jgi:hypothetical protein
MSTTDSRGVPAAPPDAMAEAMDLISAAQKQGITVRLLGGMAVRVLCPDFPPRPSTGLQDIDLASITSSRKSLQNFLIEQGHQPDKNFNALYGHKQLYFVSALSGRPIDVLIDKLSMCHELEFKGRITRMPYTLDPLDVLLSKLQIIKLNEKDVRDIVYVLSGYPVLEGTETGTISLDLYRPIVGDDWGWWRTVTTNLEKLGALIAEKPDLVPVGATYDPAAQAAVLAAAAEDAPKSRRWKMRARLGERVRWYQDPEESTHH